MSFDVRHAKDPRLLAAAIDGLQVSGAGLVADGSITEAKLDDAAVTEDKIDDEAVTEGKLATGAVTEAKLDTEAVTGQKIATGALVTYVVAAGNGAGARTMTGANTGDRVVCCVNLTDLANNASDFETEVTVDDQLQQTGTDHTGDKILVIVLAV